jgi:predicted aldo/keto reductase-like oxidoreductase
VFLVTKARTSDPKKLTEKLNTSLQRMNTSYVDMYFIHYVKNVKKELTEEVKTWAEKAKAQGKIRFFGFSAHKNMENSMMAAAKLGWIDGIMTSYNYRLMHTDSMKRGVDACVKAGIGLTAMKTQATKAHTYAGDVGKESETAEKLTERFIEKGYTFEQAKLKAVWENLNIASICSHMTNMTVLQANVAAALSKTKLSFQDRQLFEQYSRETASHYCVGCARNCEPAINNEIPISDVMRYLMYSRGYGEPERAKSAFNRLPSKVRRCLANIDYRKAELKCPQRMQIGQLMCEAAIELA